MGLLRMAARTAVVAGTATAVAGGVQHHQQEKYAQQDARAQQEYAPQPPAAPAAPAPGADDVLVEIQRLGQLKDEGLLTDEEFTAKKAQLLGI